MYAVTPPALIEVQMVGHLHEQTIRNVFHYTFRDQAAVLDGAAEALDVAETFFSDVWQNIQAMLSNEYTLDYITAQWCKPTRFRLVSKAIGQTGGIQQNSLPSTVSAVVSFHAEHAGPRFQGRKFFAGIPVGSEQNSRLNDAALALLDVVGLDIAAGLVSNVGQKRYNLTTETPKNWNGSAQFDVADYTPRNILRVQRRREVGVGE